MQSVLALLSQPIDDAPDPIARVDVAWSAVAPILVLIGGALLLLAADALRRRKPLDGSYALVTAGHRRRGHRPRDPALAARAGR